MNKILDKHTTFQDYIQVFVKRRWLLLAIFLGVTAIGAFLSLRMTSIYSATTTIRVEKKPSIISALMYYYMWDPNFFDTEVAFIKSRSLSMRVVNHLKSAYQTDPPVWKKSYLADFTLELSVLPGQYTLLVEDEEGNFVVKDSSGATIGSGKNYEEFSRMGISFTLKHPEPRKGLSCKINIDNFAAKVDGLRASITAKPMRNVNIIEVQVLGNNPIKVANLANVVAEQYIIESQQAKTQQVTATRLFIEEQMNIINTQLVELEDAIRDYKEKEGVVDISQKANFLIQEIGDYERLKASSEIDLFIAESELNRIHSALSSDGGSLESYMDVYSSPYLLQSSRYINFYANMQALYEERKRLLEFYTEEHPQVKELDAQIKSIEDAFMDSIQDTLIYGDLGTKKVELTNYITMLNKKIAILDEELSYMPEKQLMLLRLEREANAQAEIYNMLLSKYQEAKISEAMKETEIQIMDPATPAMRPIRPNHFTNIGLAAALGLILAIITILILEILDNTLNTAEEVERFTGLPLVGLIPKARQGPIPKITAIRRRDLLGRRRPIPIDRDKYLMVHLEPKSPEAEAYRSLRTNLAAVKVDGILQSILITSSVLSEGKTSIATNLATIFAMAGRKTVLVDTDLRRSIIHHIFRQKRSPGLTEVCVEKKPLSKVLRKTDIPNLHILTSGFRPPNPAEILDSKTMDDLITNLRKSYETIIFDSPPILAVTDPIILAKKVDATFIVILSQSTTYHSIKMAHQFLTNAGVEPNGTILNGIDFARSYGPYGYKYYHYYSEEDE